jgi:hypothetical protein
MQTRGVKTTVAVGAIAVLALAGCSSDSGGGSDGGNAGTDVTVEEIGTMTDCGDLQGIVDAATEASDGASKGDTSEDEKDLADAAQDRINELGC